MTLAWGFVHISCFLFHGVKMCSVVIVWAAASAQAPRASSQRLFACLPMSRKPWPGLSSPLPSLHSAVSMGPCPGCSSLPLYLFPPP